MLAPDAVGRRLGHGTSPVGNVADLLRVAAQRHGERVALITAAGSSTWTELDAAVDDGVSALHATGAVAGDRVLMALPTGPDQAAALFAVLRAGLIAVQVAPDHADLPWVGERVGAFVAITDRKDHGCRERITTADIGAWWENVARVRHPAGATGEAIAMLARSGRPGPPVMMSHRAILAAIAATMGARGFDLGAEDRLVQALPLYHLVGMVSTLLPAAMVGSAVVVPDLGTPGMTHADALLAAIRDHAVTVVPAEPTLYRQACRAEEFAASMAGVRLLLAGSYALDPADLAAVREASGLTIRQGYGISESAATVTSTVVSTGPDEEPRPGSVGLPYPGVMVRIVSDDDVEAAGVIAEGSEVAEADRDADTLADVSDDGGIGRIAINGPTLFSGYWPDGSGGPDADGWFVSGDIGFLDDAGELHLIDRMNETVVVSGFTVYPREVESLLSHHNGVADAAVIGIPGPGGSSVAGVVVPRHGADLTFSDLDEFLADKIAPFKRPVAFQLVEVLPRTEVGRLDRDALRATFATGRAVLLPPAAPPEVEVAAGPHPGGDDDAPVTSGAARRRRSRRAKAAENGAGSSPPLGPSGEAPVPTDTDPAGTGPADPATVDPATVDPATVDPATGRPSPGRPSQGRPGRCRPGHDGRCQGPCRRSEGGRRRYRHTGRTGRRGGCSGRAGPGARAGRGAVRTGNQAPGAR